MKELVKKYKSVIKFIVTFLLVYAVLTFAYKLYLDYSDGSEYYPDYMTNLVAKQTEALLNNFGYEARIERHPDEPSMKLIINSKYLARVVEGCNSLSVIILFASFVIAFAGKFKTTFFYILAGSVLIYVVNLFRIVILSIGLYHYPWRREELHTVIFPLIIYGMVFLLWMFWINRFSSLKAANE
ncbi:exosortase family protein XrtF [Gelidibacter algens]|uniref:Exosortase family protein XrtF n=1 Tax=Gelidibacter algens TaxID=49280 RepID=A0A1A7QZQ3_9FLAO|nr:exosortase family protein XrtF [Gelidibacter algens]OBX25495.1 exosortase family protein XrtF [Gelidibacter algens]RAJ22353.1 exosortase family protein XrtF [Gelidibacter algens]